MPRADAGVGADADVGIDALVGSHGHGGPGDSTVLLLRRLVQLRSLHLHLQPQ